MGSIKNVLLVALGVVVLVTCVLVSIHIVRQESRVRSERDEMIVQHWVDYAEEEVEYESFVDKARKDVKKGYLTEKEFREIYPKEELSPKDSVADRVHRKTIVRARQDVKRGNVTVAEFRRLLPNEDLGQ